MCRRPAEGWPPQHTPPPQGSSARLCRKITRSFRNHGGPHSVLGDSDIMVLDGATSWLELPRQLYVSWR